MLLAEVRANVVPSVGMVGTTQIRLPEVRANVVPSVGMVGTTQILLAEVRSNVVPSVGAVGGTQILLPEIQGNVARSRRCRSAIGRARVASGTVRRADFRDSCPAIASMQLDAIGIGPAGR